jgi:hypothetical protein
MRDFPLMFELPDASFTHAWVCVDPSQYCVFVLGRDFILHWLQIAHWMLAYW